jgi:hypothetical protein
MASVAAGNRINNNINLRTPIVIHSSSQDRRKKLLIGRMRPSWEFSKVQRSRFWKGECSIPQGLSLDPGFWSSLLKKCRAKKTVSNFLAKSQDWIHLFALSGSKDENVSVISKDQIYCDILAVRNDKTSFVDACWFISGNGYKSSLYLRIWVRGGNPHQW